VIEDQHVEVVELGAVVLGRIELRLCGDKSFVHETTIGNAALVEHAKVKVERAPNNVVVTRWIIDAPPPPTFVKAGGFTSNVDRWQIIDFVPPAFLRLDVGCSPTSTGAPQGRRPPRHHGHIDARNRQWRMR
jgi:Vanillate O-demethylase oxygenase C-terminal domain